MASWIIHLRVAQAIFEKYPVLKNREFVVGTIAPDSGVPAPDGKGYIPDGEVTHFRSLDEYGFKQYNEKLYIARYLTEEKLKDYTPEAISFHIAYAAHLVADRMWVNRIIRPAWAKFDELYRTDAPAFWKMVRRDWYDRDFLFLKNHPDFEAYKIFENAKNFKNTYVEFYAEDAIENRKDYILSFYKEGVENVEERDMYISTEELDEFVTLTAEEAIRTSVKPFIDKLNQ